MTRPPNPLASGEKRDDELKWEVVVRYGVAPSAVRIVLAPYRICPLGAHIDHQLGIVTAMAIDRGVRLAFAASGGTEIRMSSLSFPGETRFDIDSVTPRRDGDWGNFPRGAVTALRERGHRLARGIVGVTSGALAEGGLSSSAAAGVACLMAMQSANELSVSAEENIALDQAIENGYLGLRNGILDQSAILLSRRGRLTRIDCRDRSHELIPAATDAPPFSILIAFSGLQQALVSTDYNLRVTECAEAAEQLLARVGRSDTEALLGNISGEEYEEHKHLLSGAAAKRAAHFFSEMARVKRGTDAWRAGDLGELGRLMTASGESSIRQYECGAPPLVDLYEILVDTPGVHGARFSGAGFRGCCVALVSPEAAAAAAQQVTARYAERQPDLAANAGAVLICDSDDGARILE